MGVQRFGHQMAGVEIRAIGDVLIKAMRHGADQAIWCRCTRHVRFGPAKTKTVDGHAAIEVQDQVAVGALKA